MDSNRGNVPFKHRLESRGKAMGFGMRMSQSCRQMQICEHCGQSVGEHASNCPIGTIENLEASRVRFSCPTCNCYKSVEVNCSDYYECCHCNTQYAASRYVPAKTIGDVVVLIGDDLPIKVIALEDKGNGDFRVDRQIKMVKEVYNID